MSAQVVLGGEGKPSEVGQRAQVIRMRAGRIERRLVVRDVVVGMPERPLQPLELQRRDLVARGDLDRLEFVAARRQVGG